MTKKILFFFPENPFSSRAGNVTRARTNLSILKKLGYQIDLVGSKEIYEGVKDSTEVDRSVVDNLFMLKRKTHKRFYTKEYLKYKLKKKLDAGNPYNHLLTPYLKASFRKIAKGGNYSHIIINYEFWGSLLDGLHLPTTMKIVDTHDWITLNEFYKNPKLDVGKKFGSEIENLNRFDRIITISKDEYYVFKAFLGGKVVNLAPSFPDRTAIGLVPGKKMYDLLFIGSDNPFNVESLRWFQESVQPLLSNTVNICVVGRVCRTATAADNVTLIPHVEDLDDIYRNSKVSICPMLRGTGIKIKVVEALSYGLPVVGTVKAIDGFSNKHYNGCLVTDNPAQFAEYAGQLLSDEGLYKTKQTEAKNIFLQDFSEVNAMKIWTQILQ